MDRLARPDLLVPAFCPTVDSGSEFLTEIPAPESVPSRTQLLRQNQRPHYIYLVRSGVIRLSYTQADGQDVTIGLRSEGWWLGATYALLDIPSVYAATTITRCSISKIPVDDFSDLLAKNPRTMRRFISSQCREIVVQYTHSSMQAASAEERLRRLRDETNHSMWKTVDPNTIMRQCEVAKLLDITPEHLSRLLHRDDHHS